MARAEALPTAARVELVRKPRSLWGDAWSSFRRHRLAMAGTVVFSLLAVATVLGPFIYTADPATIDFAAGYQAPSLVHPFGTNDLGQDLFARALLGGRISMAVGIVAMLISITFGTLIGSLAGFFNRIDGLLMRMTDMFISLPSLPLLLLIVYLFRDALHALFGPVVGIFILVVSVIGLLNWMPVARLVRAQFLSIKRREFVEAARSIGASDVRIITRHMLPNAMSPVLVAASLSVGAAIITESALSFLGLGFPSDRPTWGRMLFDARNFLELAPQMALFPGLLIFLAVISMNYIGDGLRDALDPRRLGA